MSADDKRMTKDEFIIMATIQIYCTLPNNDRFDEYRQIAVDRAVKLADTLEKALPSGFKPRVIKSGGGR